MSFYTFTLSLHSITRWVVLIIALIAIGRAFYGWLSKKEWQKLDTQLGLAFTISLDIQVTLGLILYIVLSPFTTAAFQNFGAAMSNKELRFWAVEHISIMIIAAVLAHVGNALAKKASGQAKFQRAAIFFTLTLLTIAAAIPWAARPLLRLPF